MQDIMAEMKIKSKQLDEVLKDKDRKMVILDQDKKAQMRNLKT
jgi:hypothetical protein